MCETPEQRMSRLYDKASDFEMMHNIDVDNYRRYIRSMYQLAMRHLESEQKENAYVMYVRALICIQKLPTHKRYSQMNKKYLDELKNLRPAILDAAEKLYKELKAKYTQEHSKYMKKLENSSSPDPPLSSTTPSESISRPDNTKSSIPSPYNPTKVYLSRKLIDEFLQRAYKNTRENRETCGTLCGTLADDHFVITHLLIPKQTGTSESCVTSNEEEIIEYLNSRELIALGWIHTHPTQTAFLSAVDLHCQLPYQAMLPEAIAIVCAPKYNDVKCFSLTQNGLSFLSKCKQTGFHLHSTHLPLSEECEHVIFDDAIVHIADDLR